MSEEKNIEIMEDEEGRKIVVIPQIIFKGKRTIDWREVEKYLKCYIGEVVEVAESKDLVQIRGDFPDEYVHSEYTRKLKGGMVKVKANLVQGIKEILKIAVDKRWTENFKTKHRKKAEKGWYRYNSRFALPIMDIDGKIIGFNQYKAVLIVRWASDNHLYLYDIQNIKKEMSKPS